MLFMICEHISPKDKTEWSFMRQLDIKQAMLICWLSFQDLQSQKISLKEKGHGNTNIFATLLYSIIFKWMKC